MRSELICLVSLLAMALPIGTAAAQYRGPVHSAEDVARFRQYRGPGGTEAANAWRDSFLGNRFNRAVAMTEKGHRGTSWGYGTEQGAVDAAMRVCSDRVKQTNASDACKLYAVNNRIVWPGQEFELPALGIGFGAFTFRNQYFFQGPDRAKGVMVWQHGYGGRCNQSSASSAWSIVARFNLAGWDVVHFDRDACYDGDLAWVQSRLVASVPKLREAGYKKIVLAGQSRGAWQSYEFMAKGQFADLVDGVLGISAARHGESTQQANLRAPDDWRIVMKGIRPGTFVIANVFFGWDDYVPQAEQQSAFAREELSAKGIKNVIIYEAGEDVVPLSGGRRNGHGAASSTIFTNRYSTCLIRFIETGEKVDACSK